MDREIFRRLRTPEGQRLLERAVEAHGDGSADPVALSARLRRDHPPDLVAAALTQARLRRAATARLGSDAEVMFFTADGLEQATTREVADHRAARLASAVPPGSAAVDLGCGLGGDAIALARAGLAVTAVERDPLTAELARANLEALGLAGTPEGIDHPEPAGHHGHDGRSEQVADGGLGAGRARVWTADATALDRSGFAVVVADPARRGPRGRVFDPDAYNPPWWFVRRLLADTAAVTCVKTAPIIEHDRIDPGVTAEWVSLGGEVREAALWSGPVPGGGSGGRRRATLLRTGEPPATLSDLDDPGEADVRQLPTGTDGSRWYLYEPDGAVIRAGLVTAVAPLVDGGLLHPRIAYLVSRTLVDTPFARAYRIEQVLPYGQNQHKHLKRRLAERGVGRLTVKKRGVDVDPDRVRKQLVGSGPNAATLVLTRTPVGALALIVQPVDRVPTEPGGS